MSEKRQPWMKWYPADWRQEPTLRVCSRAARSLWQDMLGLMHEAEPYGYLMLSGQPITPKQLAAILGDREKDVVKWLAELGGARVYSIDEQGRIYSRRMVKDSQRSEEGRLWVNKRWANRDPNRGATPEPTTQIPETRCQIPETPASSPKPCPDQTSHEAENIQLNGHDARLQAKPEPRRKRRDRANRDVADALVAHRRMSKVEAWQTVFAAGDPADPHHADALAAVLKISQEKRLGWFQDE